MLSRNTSNSEVSNNIVHDHPTDYGIFVSQSPNNRIHDNILTNNLYGIYVRRPTSTGNIIENNSINGSKYGMAFVATTSNTARNNIINNASTYEYYLNNASKLTIDGQKTFSPPSTRIRGQTDINEVTIQNSGTIKITGNNNSTNEDRIDTNAHPYTSSLTNTTITVDSVGSASAGHDTNSKSNSKSTQDKTTNDTASKSNTDNASSAHKGKATNHDNEDAHKGKATNHDRQKGPEIAFDLNV
jgi:parallel beta-helix repeat protein